MKGEMARMAHIRTVIVFFKALSSKKYNLINSGAYAALSCKGLQLIVGLMQRCRAKVSDWVFVW